MRRLILILFILTFALSSGNSQIFNKNASRKVEKNLFGSSLSRKKPVKIKEPRSITKAKKQQEAKKKKLDRDYAKSVKKSQKRAFDIQTPEVQERMKQDRKTIAAREKDKKKKARASTKNAAKKYK